MLPATARLRRREDFTAVLRHGRRTGRGVLVVHVLSGGPDLGPQVGLVVGGAVGNAVRRHEVSRRLRHLVRDRLSILGGSDRLVIRATPAAAGRSSADLGRDLDAALGRLNRHRR